MSLRDAEIRERCHPLEPIATGHPAVLHKLDQIRAVLFDVYGTLLISASGDIATSQRLARDEAFADVLSTMGIQLTSDEAGVQSLLNEIDADHTRARQAGIDFPEVEIVDIWRRTLASMEAQGRIKRPSTAIPSDRQLRRLALEYELRVNPVGPMPGVGECLQQLGFAGLTLGLVSNAQFFTLDLLRSLLPEPGATALLESGLQFLSYQYGRAKPSTYLYELASRALLRRGIRCDEVLYVGNDMLNDILPASSIGFRTALFAGDARSLRLREDEPRIGSVTPDLVVTSLLDLVHCVR